MAAASPNRRSTIAATATATRKLFPGGLTKLQKHPRGRKTSNISLSAYRIRSSPRVSLGRARRAPSEIYFGRTSSMPSDRPFRAPIVTPKPLIHGIQTAKVVTKDEASERGNRRRRTH